MLPAAKGRHRATVQTDTIQIERWNEAKRVAALPVPVLVQVPVPERRQAPEPHSEPEGFFQQNWLFVFPLAMFGLLMSFAAIVALT
jgi:hypothetical protein